MTNTWPKRSGRRLRGGAVVCGAAAWLLAFGPGLALAQKHGAVHFSQPKPPHMSMPHFNPPKMPQMHFSAPQPPKMHNMPSPSAHLPRMTAGSVHAPKVAHTTVHPPKLPSHHGHASTSLASASVAPAAGMNVRSPGTGGVVSFVSPLHGTRSGYHHYYSGGHYYGRGYRHRGYYSFRPRRYYLYSNRYNTSQRRLAQLIADLDSMRPKSIMNQVHKNMFKIDLEHVVERGSAHPVAANVQQLANHVADAMTGRRDSLINTREMALALKAVMNSSQVAPGVVNQGIAETQGLLTGAGAHAADVQNVVNDLRSISGLAAGGLAMPGGVR